MGLELKSYMTSDMEGIITALDTFKELVKDYKLFREAVEASIRDAKAIREAITNHLEESH